MKQNPSPKSQAAPSNIGSSQDNTERKTEPEIKILSKDTCPSLSKRSTLGYELGCDSKKQIHIRIVSNTGSGCFNALWVQVYDILELIHDSSEDFSWDLLFPLLQGRSVNTSAFIMAALKHEGLIVQHKRKYQPGDTQAFDEKIKKLLAGKGAASEKTTTANSNNPSSEKPSSSRTRKHAS
jgi:hypothetical protein